MGNNQSIPGAPVQMPSLLCKMSGVGCPPGLGHGSNFRRINTTVATAAVANPAVVNTVTNPVATTVEASGPVVGGRRGNKTRSSKGSKGSRSKGSKGSKGSKRVNCLF
jgi:hypothetical protein